MELILAVGLKLSTKSDIKLPRSYKQGSMLRKEDRERERTRLDGRKDKTSRFAGLK